MFTLQRIIHRAKKDAAPNRAFIKRLWQQIDAELPAPTMQERMSWFTRRTAIGFAIVVPFLTMGTGAYAYTSPSVTQDSALYPMKQQIERVERSLARSAEARADFHLKMYQRRLEETEMLLRAQGAANITLDAAVNEANAANSELEQTETSEEIRQKRVEDLRKLHDRYETLRSRVPVDGTQEQPVLRDPSFFRKAPLNKN
ncbi:MAG: DUF5667 domain-containing protein [Patescibacteria group bacterium]